jgi:mRNA-degrading endonuclease RelE of RelBE toxin-antitoxin system
MWNDRLRFAERVEDDWRALSDDERAAIMQVLERIDEDPILGAPLFEPLRGYWSYRAGHLRIVYRIAPEARFVVVLSIGRASSQ